MDPYSRDTRGATDPLTRRLDVETVDDAVEIDVEEAQVFADLRRA